MVVYPYRGNRPSGSFYLPDAVVVGYSDHGGSVGLDSLSRTSGTFFYVVEQPLQAGTYTVGIYVYHNLYTDEGYQGDSVPVLVASDSLVVN